MDKIKDRVALLNPWQVPVIATDQPISAVMKQIQWHWPERYGEDKFVIMFGGLRIEMAALRSAVTLLQDSGWTGTLVEAEVASSGTAESFVRLKHHKNTSNAPNYTMQSLQIPEDSLHWLLCRGTRTLRGSAQFSRLV